MEGGSSKEEISSSPIRRGPHRPIMSVASSSLSSVSASPPIGEEEEEEVHHRHREPDGKMKDIKAEDHHHHHDDVGLGGILDEAEMENKPKVLLMGLRRSGKSSIHKVVFHKMSPNETLFIESNSKITTDDVTNSSFVQFSIWDFPGQIDFFDPSIDTEMIFGGTGALVFVIDAQDDYLEALSKLHSTVTKAYAVNPDIKFEVFIHKVDGLSDDTKMETQRDIHQRATDELAEANRDIHLNFYLTSIYDHSIFEAFSKVVQKLIPQLPTLENLLNIFISNSGIEKAFLFDVISKIYIATDSSPVDMSNYELCCDMIDVVIDVSCIYGVNDANEADAFDERSGSIIRLNNSTVLYLKEVSRSLALVCLLREENFTKQGLIDYNFLVFRKAIVDVFEVRKRLNEQKRTNDKQSPAANNNNNNNKSATSTATASGSSVVRSPGAPLVVGKN